MDDIQFFVHSIPFINDYKDPMILTSPDFILAQNKGTVNDHVILLACMLMGCKSESILQPQKEPISKKKKKDKWRDTLEDRIFVCIGNNKYTSTREFWLMIFSEDFRKIRFYDVKNNISFELRGRIKEENVDILRIYCSFRSDSPELRKCGGTGFDDILKQCISLLVLI